MTDPDKKECLNDLALDLADKIDEFRTSAMCGVSSAEVLEDHGMVMADILSDLTSVEVRLRMLARISQ